MPEWSSGFPHFLQFQSVFGNKEFMIWATVSSWSCFCWLYRASPPLAAKNIINLILVLTIWWCPCVESSLVLLQEGVCSDQCILLAKLCYPLPCFICLLQGQNCLLLQVSLDFLLLENSGGWWRTRKPGMLQSMGSQRVRHNWATNTFNLSLHNLKKVM